MAEAREIQGRPGTRLLCDRLMLLPAPRIHVSVPNQAAVPVNGPLIHTSWWHTCLIDDLIYTCRDCLKSKFKSHLWRLRLKAQWNKRIQEPKFLGLRRPQHGLVPSLLSVRLFCKMTQSLPPFWRFLNPHLTQFRTMVPCYKHSLTHTLNSLALLSITVAHA